VARGACGVIVIARRPDIRDRMRTPRAAPARPHHPTRLSFQSHPQSQRGFVPMADNAQKVRDIIEKELGVEREKLTDEASFIEDLGADSLDIVELVMEFEKEFNIDIPDEDAEKLRTVGDAIGYLNSKMGSQA
jgi:acyl carrier protein